MKIPFVDLKSQYQSIKNTIDHAISEVIHNTAFIGGKYVQEFENEFAEFCGSKYCVGVGNGTDALYIAMRALGISTGDEVITAANSFIATSEAITMTGARVVFVDCHPTTYNIDTQKIQDAITPRTRAIIPVHLYGQPADMTEIRSIAREHGLYVIEDAAQAHGAEIKGRRTGCMGDVGCFSFYPGKNLGAYGDAGAIVTNDEELASRCRMIANHGRLEKYNHSFEGVNSRMDGLQAAILSCKLKFLEQWTDMRRSVARAYNNLLDHSEIITPAEQAGMRHVYHLYVVRVPNRDSVQAFLKEEGIATGIHYPVALPNLDAYRYLGHTSDDFPVSTKYSREILSLPMFPELTKAQIEYVCHHLKTAVESSLKDAKC